MKLVILFYEHHFDNDLESLLKSLLISAPVYILLYIDSGYLLLILGIGEATGPSTNAFGDSREE